MRSIQAWNVHHPPANNCFPTWRLWKSEEVENGRNAVCRVCPIFGLMSVRAPSVRFFERPAGRERTLPSKSTTRVQKSNATLPAKSATRVQKSNASLQPYTMEMATIKLSVTMRCNGAILQMCPPRGHCQIRFLGHFNKWIGYNLQQWQQIALKWSVKLNNQILNHLRPFKGIFPGFSNTLSVRYC